MAKDNKLILYPNPQNDINFNMARRVAGILEDNGWKTAMCPYPKRPDLAETQILITFGGDGTILHAARAAAGTSIPILGINMGGKGFIAELEPDDLSLIETMTSGNYSIETRMMIDIDVLRDEKVVYQNFALNEVVIKGDNKVIEMAAYADGQMITHFLGDGTIIATPTGSTAYSMAAGGPIVEPTAKNIIITPICAHTLEAKPFVLTENREVTVEVKHKKNNPAYVSVDGGDHINIQSGDIVKVCKSEKATNLVRLSDRSFYNRISSKLVSRMNYQ